MKKGRERCETNKALLGFYLIKNSFNNVMTVNMNVL